MRNHCSLAYMIKTLKTPIKLLKLFLITTDVKSFQELKNLTIHKLYNLRPWKYRPSLRTYLENDYIPESHQKPEII